MIKSLHLYNDSDECNTHMYFEFMPYSGRSSDGMIYLAILITLP